MQCFSYHSRKSFASEKKNVFHLRFSHPSCWLSSSQHCSWTVQELQSLLRMAGGTENGVAISPLLWNFSFLNKTGFSSSPRASSPDLPWGGWESGIICASIFVRLKMRKRETTIFAYLFLQHEVGLTVIRKKLILQGQKIQSFKQHISLSHMTSSPHSLRRHSSDKTARPLRGELFRIPAPCL